MKNVRIKAKLVITWFGGKVPAPNACLVIANTTTSLTKHVVIIKILGARVKMVNHIKICRPFVKSCGVFAVCSPMLIFGNDIAALDGRTIKKNAASVNPHFFKLFISLSLKFYIWVQLSPHNILQNIEMPDNLLSYIKYCKI